MIVLGTKRRELSAGLGIFPFIRHPLLYALQTPRKRFWRVDFIPGLVDPTSGTII